MKTNKNPNSHYLNFLSTIPVRFVVVFIFCIVSLRAAAQTVSEYDTIRRNEVSVNFLPLFVSLSSYEGVSSVGGYSISYRRFLKKRFVFRTSILIGQSYRSYGNYDKFETTIADKNYFSSNAYQHGAKLQFNIGAEKIFKINRLIHSFGADIFVSKRKYNYQYDYYWFPVGANIDEERVYYSNIGNGTLATGKTHNGIDSLSYAYEQNYTDIGLQLHYTLRFRLTKRFYVSTSVGPSLSLSTYTTRHVYGNKNIYKAQSGSSFDMRLFIHDLSLAFRF